MEISAQLVKQLRERTGAGMMECKKALVEANGDVPQAEVILRKHGIASAAKKSSRTTRQGTIGSYIHTVGQIGVLIAGNCESDFVARTDDVRGLGHDPATSGAAARSPSGHKRAGTPTQIAKYAVSCFAPAL